MGRIILVLGEPGTGKSRAMKNLDPKKTIIIKPNSKELPWRGAAKDYVEGRNIFLKRTFKGVAEMITAANAEKSVITTIIVEDLTHYFSKRVMDDSKITGFGKWLDMAVDVFKNLIELEATLKPEVNLIVIAHTAVQSEADGTSYIGLQTPGKLLDNNIKIPSYFLYVLHTVVTMENEKANYQFLTNRDGYRLAKSPEDCLPMYMENDYQEVIDRIKAYQMGEDYVKQAA